MWLCVRSLLRTWAPAASWRASACSGVIACFSLRKTNKGPEGFHRGLGGLFGVAGLETSDGGSHELGLTAVGKIEVEACAYALEPPELIADAHRASRGPIGDKCVDERRRGWGSPVPAISTLLRFPSLSAQIPPHFGRLSSQFLDSPKALSGMERTWGEERRAQYSPAGCQRIPGGDWGDKNPEAPS